MRKMFIGLGLAAVFGFLILPSFAADTFQASLTSSDAGSTGTSSLTRQNEYALQCALPSCYKTGTTTPLAADCAEDLQLEKLNNAEGVYQRDFDSASDTYVVSRALDGGNPACVLLKKTTNTYKRK